MHSAAFDCSQPILQTTSRLSGIPSGHSVSRTLPGHHLAALLNSESGKLVLQHLAQNEYHVRSVPARHKAKCISSIEPNLLIQLQAPIGSSIQCIAALLPFGRDTRDWRPSKMMVAQ